MAAPKKRRRVANLGCIDPAQLSRLPESMIGPPTQQEATIMVEPTQDNIDSVVMFTACTNDQARRFLRAKQNNVEQAVNAILDGEDPDKKEGWDEGVWNTDREGNNPPALAPLGAPTRGPSPAPSLGIKAPGNQADEDEELQKAIEASQQGNDHAPAYQQETGIRAQDGTEKPVFGPAKREHYDPQNWTMVPVQARQQEMVPDVPPRERKHTDFEPRILKHLLSGDYLPNLLSIFQAIPKAKTALLLRMIPYEQGDYGYDADWWCGTPIAMPRVVHTSDGSPADPDADKYDELLMEVQRIMAVLDSSDRSYATIGALEQTQLIRDKDFSSTAGSPVEHFLQQWIAAASSKLKDPSFSDQVSGLFNTVVGTTDKDGMRTPNLTVVDMSVKTTEGQTTDLFELMDNLLWDTTDYSETSDNYIERPADIVVMRLSQANSSATSLGVEVPAALHLDKYLKENVDASRATRQKMTQGRKRVSKIEEIEKKLKHWPHPTKTTQLEAQQLLKHTHGHFSGQNRRDANEADATNNASLADDEQPGYAEIASKLEAVIASVDEKLKVLAEEKEKTRKTISEMSKAPIPGLDESQLEHRYTLRGVATKPNITYILQKKHPSDTVAHTSEDDTPEGFDWWRVEYQVNDSSGRILATRMADFDVLRAVELEHNSALLVYASEEAMSLDDGDLPEGLKKFVESENLGLLKELSTAEAEAPPPSYDFNMMSDIPRTTIERRGSNDSLAPMTGDSPRGSTGLPDYTDDLDPNQHHAYGLGYGSKPDQPAVDDPPVHEIHLDDPPDLLSGGVSTSTREVEMVEKAHSPLRPQQANGNDVAMGGMESQDMGVGGASHVEDTEMK